MIIISEIILCRLLFKITPPQFFKILINLADVWSSFRMSYDDGNCLFQGAENDDFCFQRALKSPQKFRTLGCSSANFLGSLGISGLKSKFYYEILTF